MPDFQKRGGGTHDGESTPPVNLQKTPPGQPVAVPRVSLYKPKEPTPPAPPMVGHQQPPAPTAPPMWDHQRQSIAPAPPLPPLPPTYAQRHPGPVAEPNRRPLIIGALALVAIVATIVAVYGLSRPTSGSRSTTGGQAQEASAARPCQSAPQVVVKSVDLTAAGLAVTTNLSSPCGDGDVVADANLILSVSDGEKDVAAGVFNSAAEPIIIPPGGEVERQFVFPAGMYWRTTDTLAGGSSNLSAVAAKTSSAPVQTGLAEGASLLTAVQSAPPAHGSPDATALDGLRDLADADSATVSASLEDWWVPQISSKRPGLVAEGITWTPSDILREHLALRQRYDSVRLLWAGDWRTFSAPDWWVTVVGEPSSDAGAALQWCNRNGLDADHCYAKIISSTRGVDGTTVLNK